MQIASLILAALALSSNSVLISAARAQDASAIEAFIADQAKRARGEEYPDARKIVTGDLTGDGVPETVVLYTIEGQAGSNNYVQYLAVFESATGGLVPVAHREVGGKGARAVDLTSVDGGAVRLATKSYGPKDASCCPSVEGTTQYLLRGRALSEQRRTAPRRQSRPISKRSH